MSKYNFLKKMGILGSIVCALTGCGFNPSNNIESDVYGPPIEDFDDYDTDKNSDSKKPDNSQDFDVEYNEMECIYGPPEMFEDENFNPDYNVPDEVYGPPAEDN